MLELTLTPLAGPEMAAIVGGDALLHPGPLPPIVWAVQLLEWLMDNPAPPSSYYYCKTGLS